MLAAAAALSVAGALVPIAATTASATTTGPKCFGKSPTIVSTKSHVTVRGTTHTDVIDAFGTGVTVLGLGGNDRICVGNAKKVVTGNGNVRVQFASGTIIGGKGNDTFIQKGKVKGKTIVLAGPGNDTISLIKPGAFVDSGGGLDILTIPPRYLDKTTIVPRDGLIINGVTSRIDAPSGPPDVAIAYDGDPGPVVFAATRDTTQLVGSCQDAVQFGHVVPKNGRFLSAWQINFGDGVVQNGLGGLPGSVCHSFTSDGSHVIAATQTDSAAGISTRTITVNTSSAPSVNLHNATFPSTPGLASFVDNVSPGSGATITSYFVTWGDGTYAQGAGAPPNPLTHQYASSNYSYIADLVVTDDHGNSQDNTGSAFYNDSSPTPSVSLAASVEMTAFLAGHRNNGEVPAVPAANPATLFPDQQVTLFTDFNGPPINFASLDWGDGCSYDLPFNGVNPVVGQCGTNAYPLGLTHTHSYSGPGARTITVRIHTDANPADDVVKTWSVNVIAPQTVAELSRAGIVPQGHVSMSTAGTTIAAGPSQWFFYPGDDSNLQFGSGAPPATFSHVYPSGVYYPELYVVDQYGMESRAEGYIDATSTRARWQYFGEAGDARWIPATQATDSSGTSAVCFTGSFVPSLGARPKVATIDFGDGSSQGSIRGFSDGYFDCGSAVHGYTRTGEFTAILAGRDTKGQVATEREHVSVAGRPTLGFTDSVTLNATSGQPNVTLNEPTLADTGANANPWAWFVNWNDGTSNQQQGGYGAIAASLVHSYPNPGAGHQHLYTITVEIENDHYGTTTRQLKLTVNGA